VLINNLLLYFLAERRGATRYLQFDPNLVNRDDVQQEMIEEIERHHVRWVVRAALPQPFEPNESSREGSDRLDRYLLARFTRVIATGDFEVRRRPLP
jgi:hypothetical protein